jgi:hypothetical protein
MFAKPLALLFYDVLVSFGVLVFCKLLIWEGVKKIREVLEM